MSLVGAKFICLDEKGEHGETIEAKGRKFTIGYYMSCDHVIVDKNAKGLHCEINCDAFGRVTIHNMSKEHPVNVNGQIINIKRPLLSGSKISILGKQYFWDFPKTSSSEYEDINTASVSTPQKYVGIPEQPPNSCPSFKLQRNVERRFTVHNFAYCIQSDEEGNTSSDSSISPEKEPAISTENNEEIATDADAVVLVPVMEETALEERCVTPAAEKSAVLINIEETPKTNLINCTQNKENTTTEKKKKLLSMCLQSDIVITSFSPRETGVRTEKSFTAILKPTTPKSLYSTPKSILSEFNADGSLDIDFSTPATSKKTMLRAVNNSSMHLIDLTTPSQLRPASPSLKSIQKTAKRMNIIPKTEMVAGDSQKRTSLSNVMKECGVSILRTPKTGDEISATETPDSVISINSTDSSSVVEVSEDSSTLGSPSFKAASIKTPNKPEISKINTTPKRTPQSLMKRALLTSAKKQITTQGETPKSGTASSGLLARRQSLTSPHRKNTSNVKSKLPNATGSLQARRSLYAMPGRTLTTSTPDGRSRTVLRVSPKSSPLHRVRKSVGDSILSSHISKSRSVVQTNKPSPSSSITPTRKSLYASPGSARARAIAASASKPTSILKGSQLTKKQDDQKKAVLFSVEGENDLSRTFTIDSDTEMDNLINDTLSPIKKSKEVTDLNVTFSPEKQKPEVNEEQILIVEMKDVIHEAKALNAEVKNNEEVADKVFENNDDNNEDNDDLLEQIDDVLNKSDELQKQSKGHESYSIIKEDEVVQSVELESLSQCLKPEDIKNSSIKDIENSELCGLPKENEIVSIEANTCSERDESNIVDLKSNRLDASADVAHTTDPSVENKISKEEESSGELSTESWIHAVDTSAKISSEPQTPNLRGVKELLRSPKGNVVEKRPNFVGIRDMIRTPKHSKIEDCSELLGVDKLLRTSNDQANSTELRTEQLTFTPRRSARRASLSADSFRTLTPKRITKRRASISVDTDAKSMTPKQKIPHLKTFAIFNEIEEDMDDIAKELSPTIINEVESKTLELNRSVENQHICVKNKKSIIRTVIEEDALIEEGTCEVLNYSECSSSEDNKQEILSSKSMSTKHSKSVDMHNKSDIECPSGQYVKTDSISAINDCSDYSYGEEVSSTSADFQEFAEIKADIMQDVLIKTNDLHEKTAVETIVNSELKGVTEPVDPIVNSELKEVTETVETEKPSTSSEAKLNLIGGLGQCSTPRTVKTPKADGMKELMDTPTQRTPLNRSSVSLKHGLPKSKIFNQSNNLSKCDDENLNQFFRTPRAKNVMILGTPKSINIKRDIDSVELVHSTEYELNTTDVENLEDLFKTPVASRLHANLSNEDESETIPETGKEFKNLSAEEAFDELVGQSSQIQTPARKVYTRKSLPLQNSPFSNTDVISDLPKTDIQEWVDSLEDVDVPPNSEFDPPEEEISMTIDDNEISYDPLLASTITEANTKDDIGDTTCQDTTVSECLINISAVSSVVDPLSRSVAFTTENKNSTISQCLSPVNESLPSEEACIEQSEISGIKLLDKSGDSNLLEPLVVSDTDSNLDTTLGDGNLECAANVLNDSTEAKNLNLEEELTKECVGDTVQTESTSSFNNIQQLHTNIVSQPDETLKDDNLEEAANDLNVTENSETQSSLTDKNPEDDTNVLNDTTEVEKESEETEIDKCLEDASIVESTSSSDVNIQCQPDKTLKDKIPEDDTNVLTEVEKESEETQIDECLEDISIVESTTSSDENIKSQQDKTLKDKNPEGDTNVLNDTTEVEKECEETEIDKYLKDASIEESTTSSVRDKTLKDKNPEDDSNVLNDTTDFEKEIEETEIDKCLEDVSIVESTTSSDEHIKSQQDKTLKNKNPEDDTNVLNDTTEVEKESEETQIDECLEDVSIVESTTSSDRYKTLKDKNPEGDTNVLNDTTEVEKEIEETEIDKCLEDVSIVESTTSSDEHIKSQQDKTLKNKNPEDDTNVLNDTTEVEKESEETQIDKCLKDASIVDSTTSSDRDKTSKDKNPEDNTNVLNDTTEVEKETEETQIDKCLEDDSIVESKTSSDSNQQFNENILSQTEEILKDKEEVANAINDNTETEKLIPKMKIPEERDEDALHTETTSSSNDYVLGAEEKNTDTVLSASSKKYINSTFENTISKENDQESIPKTKLDNKDKNEEVCTEITSLNKDISICHEKEIANSNDAIEIDKHNEHLEKTESEESFTLAVDESLVDDMSKSVNNLNPEDETSNSNVVDDEKIPTLNIDNLDGKSTTIVTNTNEKSSADYTNIKVVSKFVSMDDRSDEKCGETLKISQSVHQTIVVDDKLTIHIDIKNEESTTCKDNLPDGKDSSIQNETPRFDNEDKIHGPKIAQTIHQTIVDEKAAILDIKKENSAINNSKENNFNVNIPDNDNVSIEIVPKVDFCETLKLNLKDSENDGTELSGEDKPTTVLGERKLDEKDIPKELQANENIIHNCNDQANVSSNVVEIPILEKGSTDSAIDETFENKIQENQKPTIKAIEPQEALRADDGVKSKKNVRTRTTRRGCGKIIKDQNIDPAHEEYPESTTVSKVSGNESIVKIDKDQLPKNSEDEESSRIQENDINPCRLTRRRKIGVAQTEEEDGDSQVVKEDIIMAKTTRRKVAARVPKTEEVDELNHLEKNVPTRRGGRNKKESVETHTTDNNEIEEDSVKRNNEESENTEHSNKSTQKGRKRKGSHTESTDAENVISIETVPVKKRVTRKANTVVKQDETPQSVPAPRRTRKASTIDAIEDSVALAVTPKQTRRRGGLRTATAHHCEESDQLTHSETEQHKENDDDSLKHPSDDSETLTTSRGRTRKPTARAQQFLEEERSRTGTPKKKVLSEEVGVTPQKMPARRGRKASTIESESTSNTPQLNNQLPNKRGRGRKIASEQSHAEIEIHSEEHKVSSIVDEVTTVHSTRRVRGRAGAIENNSEESHLESCTEELEVKKDKANKSKARTHARKETKNVETLKEADEPAKKKPLNILADDEIVVETAGTKTRTTGRRRPVNKKVEDNHVEPKEEGHSSEIEEEKPKKTRSRARGKQKVVTEEPLKREHRVVSASTVDGHSDLDDDNNDGSLEANSEENSSAHHAEVTSKRTVASRKVHTETVTDSPATKRSRRNPVQEMLTEVLTPTKTRGGGRTRKVVTFDTPTAETTEEQTDEAPKRITRATRKKLFQ